MPPNEPEGEKEKTINFCAKNRRLILAQVARGQISSEMASKMLAASGCHDENFIRLSPGGFQTIGGGTPKKKKKKIPRFVPPPAESVVIRTFPESPEPSLGAPDVSAQPTAPPPSSDPDDPIEPQIVEEDGDEDGDDDDAGRGRGKRTPPGGAGGGFILPPDDWSYLSPHWLSQSYGWNFDWSWNGPFFDDWVFTYPDFETQPPPTFKINTAAAKLIDNSGFPPNHGNFAPIRKDLGTGKVDYATLLTTEKLF